MDSFRDLVVNILAAILIFAFGVSTRSLIGFAKSWRGRRFWGREIIRGRTRLFLGSFNRFNHLEPSGLIGLGDNHAVHELATTLGRFGVSFEIAYASRLMDSQHRENLILLGLDEVNSLIPPVFEKIGTKFRVDSGPMTIEDLDTGKLYTPKWEVRTFDEETLSEFDDTWLSNHGPDGARMARSFRVDYGVLIRARSPFAPHRTLVVIAGIYGFGTWAGARLPTDEEFLRRCARLNSFNFECLYRVEVLQGQLLSTSVVELREIPDANKVDP